MSRLSILDAIKDRNLFGRFLGKDLKSWRRWLAALRVLYGLPTSSRDRRYARQCMSRKKVRKLKGFKTALFLTGRRSGKSRIAAIIAAFEAVLAGHEKRLAPGEQGMVACIATTKRQGAIVWKYIQGVFAKSPMLKDEVVRETSTGFELRNGVVIEVLHGDFRTVRGHTLLAAVVDEVCFFGLAEADKIRSDRELIRALQPALATTGGRLIAISSPYAARGWAYSTWKKHHNDKGKVLVWRAASRYMNPTLRQSVIDAEMAEDPVAARAEYYAHWREDVAEFLPRVLIEGLVTKGRKELPRDTGRRYFAFCDVSGGRKDASALAIAHSVGRTVVIDAIRHYKSPQNPHVTIAHMASELARYGLRRVVGDNYGADFVSKAFERHGVRYVKSEKPKGALYLEFVPRACAGEVELLDHELLVDQLAMLERRTRSGGKDLVDHPRGAHDDLANAVAGVCAIGQGSGPIVGGGLLGVPERDPNRADALAELLAGQSTVLGFDFGAPHPSR